jgi:hypothetical protein
MYLFSLAFSLPPLPALRTLLSIANHLFLLNFSKRYRRYRRYRHFGLGSWALGRTVVHRLKHEARLISATRATVERSRNGLARDTPLDCTAGSILERPAHAKQA